MDVWANVAILLMCVCRDTRRRELPRVDGLSTNTPVLGHHSYRRILLDSVVRISHFSRHGVSNDT